MILSHFEQQTKGLVFGPAILAATDPVALPIGLRKGCFTPLADSRVLPHVEGVETYKVSIRARESGEVLWMRAFATRFEALTLYAQLIGPAAEPWARKGYLPGRWIDGDVEYIYAIVATYTASNTTNADWPTGNRAPAGVNKVDALLVAGGGAGGGGLGAGGGGAGGMRSFSDLPVVPLAQRTITIGPGGTASTGTGMSGSNSVFGDQTALGGGGGGPAASGTGAGLNGGSGGGGGTPGSGTSGPGGNGTAGQGNNGGAGLSDNASFRSGGSGGGAGTPGAAATSGTGVPGGNGLSSSISGSAVDYAGGGGSGTYTAAGGPGGSGGGGNGGSNAAGSPGQANRGGGGGGSGGSGAAGGAGGSGILVLSYTPRFIFGFNMSMMGL